MFYSTIQLSTYYPHFATTRFFFDIIQIGTGGNGGYLVQRLSKLIYSLQEVNDTLKCSYKLVDGDLIESKNLLRQPFIEEDINQSKVDVLAERYGNAYDIPIFGKANYIEKSEDVIDLFQANLVPWGYTRIPILLGCVDNNATRQIMHKVFEEIPNIIYIDSGIDSIDEEDSLNSGYSGQVVCGFKHRDKEILAPVGKVYPNILEDQDSRLPTQACGTQVVNHPQRMQTNEFAALIMNGYMNTILSDCEIVSHYTNFNAKTMMVRPTYIQKEVLAI